MRLAVAAAATAGVSRPRPRHRTENVVSGGHDRTGDMNGDR